MPHRTRAGSPLLFLIAVSLGGCAMQGEVTAPRGGIPVERSEERDGDFGVLALGGIDLEYEVVEGRRVLDGDIVLPTDEDLARELDGADSEPGGDDVGRSREGLASRQWGYFWHEGVIPYRIHPDVVNPARVHAAIAQWEALARVRFVAADRGDAVEFIPGTGNCQSEIGRHRGRNQYIWLNSTCPEATVVHEIGHTLGLFHEHNRADREQYVEIRWANIRPEVRHNFSIYNRAGYAGFDSAPYDVRSIMHYPGTAGSRALNLPTIIDRRTGLPTPQNYQLSATDVTAFSTLYGDARVPFEDRVVDIEGTSTGGGAWVLTNRGQVLSLGDSAHLGSVSAAALGAAVAVSITARPDNTGYWILTSDGEVHAFGAAYSHGGLPGQHVVDIERTPWNSYWVLTGDGRVAAFGENPAWGDASDPSAEWVAMAAIPNGTGYHLLARDGRIESLGYAPQMFQTNPHFLEWADIEVTFDGQGVRCLATSGHIQSNRSAGIEVHRSGGGYVALASAWTGLYAVDSQARYFPYEGAPWLQGSGTFN